MKKLIVHIGTAKAGSSTVQRFLIDNQRCLATQCGYWIVNHNLELGLEVKRFPVAYFESLFHQVEPGNRSLVLAETWKKFAQKMERAGKKAAIISAESLSMDPAFTEFFESATPYFQIHVIAYFRRQDEWIASAWKQWPMKTGITLDEYARQCISAKSPNFYAVFNSWEKIVKPENIIIKPLLKDFIHPQGLARDFSEAAGIHDDALNYETPVINSTFDYSILSILQSKPSIFRDSHDNDLFNYLEKFSSLTKSAAGNSLIDPELQRLIIESFADENRQTHRAYFPKLDYDDVFSLSHETAHSKNDLVKALSEVAAIQFKMLQVLDQEVENLKLKNSPTAWLASLYKLFRRWNRSAHKRMG